MMQSIERFLGNHSEVKKLIEWLNDYYHNPTKEIKPYVIIQAISGNGKSLLPQLLSEDFGVKLFTISPIDVNSGEELDNFIKSINLADLSGSKEKIILVDDIIEFSAQYRKKLFAIYELSNHPLIYTTSWFGLPSEFISKGLIIKIKKPLIRELYEHLQTFDSDLSDEMLWHLAEESKSVRSAVNSLYNASINDLTNPVQTRYETMNSVKKRCLNRNIDTSMLSFLFTCINSYDDNGLDVMERFADFDYRINRKHKEIGRREVDMHAINNMVEPLGEIKLEYKVHKNNYKKKNDIKRNVVKEKVQIEGSVGKWL